MTAQAPSAPVRPVAGSWPGRPAGVPGAVPPPPLPLSFLAAAAFGLIASGAVLVWARGAGAADPTAGPVIAAAHLGMLATLSMGVLGAMHQFTPVVTQRPLRSIRLGWATFLAWLAAAWLLPFGIATGQEGVAEAGGGLAAVAIALLVVNLWRPLSARGKGAPVTGLRLAVAGFVTTACFGVVYVGDRRGGWFVLAGHVVLAHAVIGLFAWLGLTYVSVAGKLWPMFFLSHVPGRHRAAWVAVWAVPAGVALLSPGLLLGLPWLAWAGAAVLAAGLGAHLVSLEAHLRHRRRKADLHLVFVGTSALWLPAGAGLALAAALLMAHHHHAGMALAAAAVTAFAGWLLEALVGHAHKVVPFIVWSVLRARGISTVSGRPLGFADLYDHRLAAVVYGLVTVGIAALCIGFGASLPAAIAAGGVLLIASGVAVAVNLSLIPARMLWGPGTSRVGRPAQQQTAEPETAQPAVTPRRNGERATTMEQAHHADPGRQARSATLSWVAIAVAGVAVLMAASALWPGRPGGAGTAATSGASSTVVANGEVKTFSVELGDMFVRPSSISVPYGTRVVLHVANDGAMSHDLQLEGGSTGTGMLSPGQRKTVDYGIFGHTEQAWCTVPGHMAAGMVLAIKVTGAGGGRASSGTSGMSGPGMSGTSGTTSAGTSAGDAAINLGATPGAGWRPFDAALAPAPGGAVHRVTMVAQDKQIQVAPGVTQDMWTFNGQVPGPTLRGHVGDLFIVTLVNHSNMGHSLDFHAASQPMEAMRTIGPGQSMTERFRARYAGIFLYHCGTAPTLEHLANGMFGAVIIDPPHLAPVSHEFLIEQSELYLGPQGRSGDYTKMLRGQPDAVVFNEYANQYLFSPLRVRAGQRVRIWVLDAGPSDDSAFHVVGAQFDTVFNNGAYLLQPGDPADGAAQTLNLMPGEGGFVEFTVPAAGMYEMVDHHFDHAATGAAGYLVASAP
jgi:nitrite reductase (NO-forming)